MYKPLPKQLRLGFSDIHDIGLFAKEDIPKGTKLYLENHSPKITSMINKQTKNTIVLKSIIFDQDLNIILFIGKFLNKYFYKLL